MNITKDEAQMLGFQKIWKVLIEGDTQEFFRDLQMVNGLTSACKLSPYSAYGYLDLMKQLTYEEAGGIVTTISANITGALEVSAVKRKFRDSWEKMWLKFGEACNLDAYDVDILTRVSIKIPVLILAMETGDTEAMRIVKFSKNYYSALNVEQEMARERGYLYNNVKCINKLCRLINMVANWQRATSFDSTPDDAVRYLALSSFEEFEHDLSSGEQMGFENEDIDVNLDGATSLERMSTVYIRSEDQMEDM